MMHLWPSLKPQGGFPRAARALKGWRRLVPARARRPIPWLAACAMMGTLLFLGKDDLAFAILIAFVCYLRPGELCGLRPEQIVAPVRGAGPEAMQWGLILGPLESGKPNKTGEFDESALIDWEELNWIGPFMRTLQLRPRAPPCGTSPRPSST